MRVHPLAQAGVGALLVVIGAVAAFQTQAELTTAVGAGPGLVAGVAVLIVFAIPGRLLVNLAHRKAKRQHER